MFVLCVCVCVHMHTCLDEVKTDLTETHLNFTLYHNNVQKSFFPHYRLVQYCHCCCYSSGFQNFWICNQELYFTEQPCMWIDM